MLDRRTLLGASAAVMSLFGASAGGRKAHAKTQSFADVEPRGTVGRLERLPTLDLESQQDFLTGFRTWANRELSSIASKRVDAIFEVEGIDPKAELKLEEVLPLIETDPVVGSSIRAWISCQQLSWNALKEEFHGNADKYLAEMESADRSGPGSLELNPEMHVPDYTKHEIHIQPGGYVGDAFAGHIYHYGTNNFYTGHNDQDQIHIGLANAVPGPTGGSVKRILDLGCGTGQLTVALKERFPEAEVWGIDIGGPMVRYAHMRAVDLGVETHFAQRLAEDTRFPDNHFDIVTSYIMFHEVTLEASKQIIAEAHRILRPGGAFHPIDFGGGIRGRSRYGLGAYRKARGWWDHRWNNEIWRPEYAQLDWTKEMGKAGFDVETDVAHKTPFGGGFGNVTGTKRA